MLRLTSCSIELWFLLHGENYTKSFKGDIEQRAYAWHQACDITPTCCNEIAVACILKEGSDPPLCFHQNHHTDHMNLYVMLSYGI